MGSSIASTFVTCLRTFEDLIDVFRRHGEFSTQVSPDYLEDQLGRLRIWAGNIGAHRVGKVSLDHRLREASHIQSRIIQLLSDLENSTKEGLSIISGERPPLDSVSDCDSSSDDEPSLGLQGEEAEYRSAADKPTELQLLLQTDVPDIITCLYKLSQAIRSPAPHDTYIKSAAINISYFEYWDIKHAENKFPDAPEFLLTRLGRAISRRRQYLKYCEKHRRKLGLDIDSSRKSEVVRKPCDVGHGAGEADRPSQIPFENREPLPKPEPSKTATTVLTDTTATTFIAFNDHVEAESDSGETQTSYAGSEGAVGHPHLHPPPPPSNSLNGQQLECPYCFTIISIKNTHSWMKHLFGDLQPYTCVFEKCSTPDKLYGSRHNWVNHDSSHRIEYFCSADCQQAFKFQDEFEHHMFDVHANTFTRPQLPALAKMCQRPTRSDVEATCPLCLRRMPTGLIQHHLARHMLELSLFALPRQEADTEEAVGSDKAEASYTGTRSPGTDPGPTSIREEHIELSQEIPSDSMHTRQEKEEEIQELNKENDLLMKRRGSLERLPRGRATEGSRTPSLPRGNQSWEQETETASENRSTPWTKESALQRRSKSWQPRNAPNREEISRPESIKQNSSSTGGLQPPEIEPVDVHRKNPLPEGGMPFRQPTDDSRNAAILVAVMGQTGTGKSSFINNAAGTSLRVGHALRSCTQDIEQVGFSLDGHRMILIDSPAFDDNTRTDIEILQVIGLHLQQCYKAEQFLTGVIYMQKITDNRIRGSALSSLRILRTLCGADNYHNIALVTSCWDLVPPDEGEDRERELRARDEFWGEMIRGGATVNRYSNTRESAVQILRQFLPKSPFVSQFQKEYAATGGNVGATAVGREISGVLLERLDEYKKRISELTEENRRTEIEKDRMETEMQTLKRDMERLKQDMEGQREIKEELRAKEKRGRIQDSEMEELKTEMSRIERDRAMVTDAMISMKQTAIDEIYNPQPGKSRRLRNPNCATQ